MLGRILLLCSLVLLSGCSAKYHMKQAKKHIEKAKSIDPSISTSDTTIVPRDTVIEIPSISIDTLVDLEQPTDTAVVIQDDVKVKTAYDPIKKKQWIKVEKPVKKDTIQLKDKIITETVIIPETPWYRKLSKGAIVLGVLALLIIIGSVFRKLFL